MDPKIEIDLQDRPPWQHVYYRGPITADAEERLIMLTRRAVNKVVVNLRGVTQVNSNGVRCWILFLQQFVKGREVRIEECSPVVVEQMGMIPGFYQGAEVASIVAMYECKDCNSVREELVTPRRTKSEAQTALPTQICKACNKPMTIDECTEDFLQFFIPAKS